jgi:type II secretory pathway pseudopilin PulG
MDPADEGRELVNVAVLGLILLAAAGVLTAAVVTSNTTSLSMDLWGAHVSNITLGVVFVAGMITTVLAVVGLGLLTGALRRSRRLRNERRSLRRENQKLSQRVESGDGAADGPYEPASARRDTRPVDSSDSEPVPWPSSDDTAVVEQPRRRGFLPRRDEPAGNTTPTHR